MTVISGTKTWTLNSDASCFPVVFAFSGGPNNIQILYFKREKHFQPIAKTNSVTAWTKVYKKTIKQGTKVE